MLQLLIFLLHLTLADYGDPSQQGNKLERYKNVQLCLQTLELALLEFVSGIRAAYCSDAPLIDMIDPFRSIISEFISDYCQNASACLLKQSLVSLLCIILCYRLVSVLVLPPITSYYSMAIRNEILQQCNWNLLFFYRMLSYRLQNDKNHYSLSQSFRVGQSKNSYHKCFNRITVPLKVSMCLWTIKSFLTPNIVNYFSFCFWRAETRYRSNCKSPWLACNQLRKVSKIWSDNRIYESSINTDRTSHRLSYGYARLLVVDNRASVVYHLYVFKLCIRLQKRIIWRWRLDGIGIDW
jgi:hypothetical protein